jgi:hypothetical protein
MKQLLCCLVLLLACTQLSLAGPVKNNDVSLNLQMSWCLLQYCNFDAGWAADGGPGSGWADFSMVNLPYSFSFETPAASSWQYFPGFSTYWAVYGYGGFFDMVGPDGLTFTGVVTSGSSGFNGLGADIMVNYFGQWSNGVYADGSAEFTLQLDSGNNFVTLTNQPAPEPSSLFLLGSGALGLLGLRRKLC